MAPFRRRRIRRVLKWGGLVLSLVILGAWVVSLRWEWFYWKRGDHSVYVLSAGALHVRSHIQPNNWSGFSRVPRWFTISTWNWRVYCSSQVAFSLILPLWIPFLVLALPTAILFWRDRRRIPPGHCQRCGYNLTGNVSGLCSECGTPIPENRPGR